MIFELVQDFRDALAKMPVDHPKYRMLELLEEALRRRSHFLARRPTTVFQCLWETCWWFDYPEHERDAAPQPGPNGLPDPERKSPRMHLLLEEWRKHVKRPWLRPIRPPEKPLGQSPHYSTIQANEGWIERIRFSPSGEFIISAGRDGNVAIVNEQLSQVIYKLEHCSPVTALAFASEDLLFSGTRDGTIYAWDPLSGVLRGKVSLRNDRVMDLAIDLAGQFLVAALADGTIAYCPISAFPDGWRYIGSEVSSDRIPREYQQSVDGDGTDYRAIYDRNYFMHRICAITDPLRIFSSSQFGRMREWDSTIGDWTSKDDGTSRELQNRVLAYSPDSRVSLCIEDKIGLFLKVVATATGEALSRPVAHRYLVTAADISSGGPTYAFVTGQGIMETLVVPSPRPRSICQVGYSTDVAISPKNEKKVITSHPNGDLRCWDTRRTESRSTALGYEEVVRAAFSPDGSKLFVESFHDVMFEVSDLSQYDVATGIYECELDRRSPILDTLKGPFRPAVEWPPTAEKSESTYLLVLDEHEVLVRRAADGAIVGWIPGRKKLLAAHPLSNIWALRDWDRSGHFEIVALEIPQIVLT